MTPTITRRGIVTIALAAIFGLTLIILAIQLTTAQDIGQWATPVPETPVPVDLGALADAIVAAIIAIIRQIVASLGEALTVVIGR